VSWSAKRCCRVIRQFRGPRATDNEPPKVQQQLRAAQQSKSWVAQPPARAWGPKYCTRRRSQIRWTCASLLFLASEATGLTTMRWRWTAACACACALVGGLGGLGGLHPLQHGSDANLQPPHHQPSRPSAEACQGKGPGSGTYKMPAPMRLAPYLLTGAWAMQSPVGGFLWVPSAVTQPRAPPLLDLGIWSSSFPSNPSSDPSWKLELCHRRDTTTQSFNNSQTHPERQTATSAMSACRSRHFWPETATSALLPRWP
jgi:hypothetical protein